MTTAIDSNVLIGLWSEDEGLNLEAQRALDLAAGRGALVIAAPVYLEIRAVPERDEAYVDRFLTRARIAIEWELGEDIWREAAKASHRYGHRRVSGAKPPRRIAADFLIGAHAAARGFNLLTFDRRTFSASFPTLRMAQESS